MAIAVSHGGSNVYSAERPSTELFVGTQNGVVVLERTGGGWRQASHGVQGQHISSIIIEPESSTALAGGLFGSVSASTDGGRTWERRDSGITKHDVYSLARKKLANGTTRVYAGTEPAHLFQSDDLGEFGAPLRNPQPSGAPWCPRWPPPPDRKLETALAGRQGRRRRTGQGAAEPRRETAWNPRRPRRYHQPAGDVKRTSSGIPGALSQHGAGPGPTGPCDFRSSLRNRRLAHRGVVSRPIAP